MNQADIINRLINRGWIVFNPYTMATMRPRYQVILTDTEEHLIEETDITELVTDLILKAEQEPIQQFKDYKKNAFIDVHALDSFAEVVYLLCFPTINQLVDYKKKYKIDTLYYIDTRTDSVEEL